MKLNYCKLPNKKLNLKLNAPIETWDEAIPLGNGLMGGLLWGSGNLLRLSLDRGDLWDERPAAGSNTNDFNYATIKRLVREGRTAEANRIMDYPYSKAHPTKLPGGRLEIKLAPSMKVKSYELNLSTAEGIAWFEDGGKAEVFFSAVKPVALMRIYGSGIDEFKIVTPFAHDNSEGAGYSAHTVKSLGYKKGQSGSGRNICWHVQEIPGARRYCVCAMKKHYSDHTLIALTITLAVNKENAFEMAKEMLAESIRTGYPEMLKPHCGWWRNFWAKSSISLPKAEENILRHYYLVRYFYGAASRRGAPPMPLQGVWTADDGGLPPWKGDYHNDLNTQMTYIAYYESGNFDDGACFLDYLWNLLPVFRKFAREFYAAPGAAVPGVMTLAGQALGGWGQYSLSPAMGAWNGHLFYLHWLYTGDKQFLKERAYPWCSEIGEFLTSMLKPDGNGRLILPLSSSPEIFDNTARAWLTPNSNYDIACLKMLFLALVEMASQCGKDDEILKWKNAAVGLGDLYVNENSILKLNRNTDLPGSHRHLSNIIGIFPFNLISIDGLKKENKVIESSLKEWERLDTGEWCGYTFSWMSCMQARIGNPEAAVKYLDIFLQAFILRNGFHVNGDQTASGFSKYTYRPFTLEGNFLAMQSVHEMLLQSWSRSPGKSDTGVIRIFPSVPCRMHDVEFKNLRTEGGHSVSAKRKNNATTWFKITAGKDGIIRIRDNFGQRKLKWNMTGIRKQRGDYELYLKKDQSVTATRMDCETMNAGR